ncbi:protein phosphatase 1 regulatory subunit 21-like isoform X1 [Bolinopsis microptera]|uniref:protein phosphatase 1 regulatory subunit 21-like isoform X1 n=1 Tax=Bolinopsis microptera TaxID=2820187 RepID=UPI00307AD6C2
MTHLLSLMDNRSISPPSSITSCSRDSEDLASKYQRLANQYAQVRAQVVVLKKALLDEREKHSYIKDNDVGKGQKIRTLEQEVDSLTFRNKQLSARIDSLQQQLDTLAKKKGKGKQQGRNDVSNKDVDSIHLEELESKIRENEVLHTKLQTVEERYGLKLQKLEDENASLTSAKRNSDTLLKTSKEDFELSLSKEQRRSSTLQVQLDKLQAKLDAANAALARSRASKTSAEPSNKSDTKLVKCKNLNLYAKDKKRASLIENTLEVVGGYITEIVVSLQNYCTYLEQRTQLYSTDLGEPITHNTQQMCGLLLENTSHIRPMLELWSLFVITVRDNQFSLKSCGNLEVLANQYTDITNYLSLILNLFKKSLSEESMSMSCSLQMEECNTVICDSVQPLVLALQNSAVSLSHVSNVEDSTGAAKYIPAFIGDVKDVCTNVRSHISAIHPKLVLAHKLSSVSQRLKTTDECCVASLQSFVNTLTKIARHLEDSLSLLTKSSRFSAEQESVYNSTLTTTCEGFLSLINRSQPLSDRNSSPDPTSPLPAPSPDLTDKLKISKEKIAKLEQSKEHWMLEAQLLTIKLDKAQKRLLEKLQKPQLKEAENNKMTSPSSNVPVDTLLDLTDSSSSVKTVLPWDDSGLREEAIRLHYTNRINEQIETIQKAEGECILNKRECIGLKKRLHIAEKQHNQFAVDMCNNDKVRQQLEEELTLTKDKYEAQIALMSEHLCAMNDKLVNLNEENQTLKLDTPKQGRKKW